MVESALTPESAIKCFKQGDFDLILLCHSISSKDRDDFICSIRGYGSRVPIVCLPPDPTGRFPSEGIHVARRVLDVIALVMKNTARHSAMGATIYLQNWEDYSSETWSTAKAVLCVHDNQEYLDIERRLLEDAGYMVLTSRNCVDSLDIFSTGVADAVVLSYSMPTRNTGVLAMQMRQKSEDIPLILVAGTSSVPNAERSLFDHILPKRRSPWVLAELLGDLLQRPLDTPVRRQ